MSEIPLVSCLSLIDKIDKKYVLNIMDCFRSQTYTYKELILINNAANQFEASAFNIDAEPNIFIIDTPMKLPAGSARNYGIFGANGQILAQFDPDYWFHESRIESQVKSMVENDSQISMLSSTLSYSYNSGIAGIEQNDKNFILNTMVFVRPQNVDYPHVAKNEEFGLLARLLELNCSAVSLHSPNLALKFYRSIDENISTPTRYDDVDKNQIDEILSTIRH